MVDPRSELEFVTVETTLPSEAECEALADRLVTQRLAACVQREGPIASTYVWQGKLERASEFRLVAKTTRGRVAKLSACIEASHPYEVPELVVKPFEARGAYAAWLREALDES